MESDKLTLPVKTGITDSVGLKGKNIADDVKTVQQKLKDLGYPVKEASGNCDPETIKAIKFFQASINDVASKIKKYQAIDFPDGLISKGGATEQKLFKENPSKYLSPTKKTSKPIAGDIKKKIDSSTGDIKKLWDKIIETWDLVSPLLPADSNLTSGYRSASDQRSILQQWFNVKYKDSIIEEFSDSEWKTYKDMQGKNDAVADPKMCQMIKEATGQLIAVPGRSAHEKGKAIDIGGSADIEQIKSLLWVHVENGIITKILPERNGCLHFEFN
jgi:hypothetical protein